MKEEKKKLATKSTKKSKKLADVFLEKEANALFDAAFLLLISSRKR